MAYSTKPYLALLRGINVGGKNIIGKDDLKKCFEDLGCTQVRTYIQSGNILFRSALSKQELTPTIENGLSARFGYAAVAVIISRTQYRKMVAAAPEDWGNDEDYKHNALFMLRGHRPASLLKKIPKPKPIIEKVALAPGAIFWSVSKKDLTRTSLMKLAALPEYQKVTVRNHNTVFRLQSMFDEI